jgi:hypothetical protein
MKLFESAELQLWTEESLCWQSKENAYWRCAMRMYKCRKQNKDEDGSLDHPAARAQESGRAGANARLVPPI